MVFGSPEVPPAAGPAPDHPSGHAAAAGRAAGSAAVPLELCLLLLAVALSGAPAAAPVLAASSASPVPAGRGHEAGRGGAPVGGEVAAVGTVAGAAGLIAKDVQHRGPA